MKDFVHDGAFILSAGFKNDAAKRNGAHATAGIISWAPGVHLSAANLNASNFNITALVYAPAPPAHVKQVKRTEGFYADFGKRALDLFLIFLALPMIVLVIGVGALCLMIEGGKPFYWQERIGHNGRKFRILKLRTMVRDADALLEDLLRDDADLRHEWETTQKLKEDPRITRVGAFLRRSSLDELPQLWNVAKGEMSLVGPRPMMPCQAPIYGDTRYYEAVRPGITGIWQVSERNESAFSYRRDTDRQYYFKLSLAQDVKLLFQTVGAVLRGTGY